MGLSLRTVLSAVNTGMRLADKGADLMQLFQDRKATQTRAKKVVSSKKMGIPDGSEDLDLEPKTPAAAKKSPSSSWGTVLPKEKIRSIMVDASVFHKIRRGVLKFVVVPISMSLHVGDYLVFQEYDNMMQELTGDWVIRMATMVIQNNPGIVSDHMIISLADAEEARAIQEIMSMERFSERSNYKLNWKVEESPAGQKGPSMEEMLKGAKEWK